MDLSTLIEELAKPEYTSLSDQAAADTVNAKTVAVHQAVPIAQIKEYAIVNSIWSKVKTGQSSANTAVSALCVSIIDWVEDPRISTLNVNLPQVQSMLSGLVSAGIISEQQRSEVIAMGSKRVSWTSQNGLPEVGIGLVINARKAIAGGD